MTLGRRDSFSHSLTSLEWKNLYNEAERQAVTGIMLHGIDRLPAGQRPSQIFLLQWIGEGQMIVQQNLIMDKRCCQLLGRLRDFGLRGTILKGQGISLLYDKELRPLRQSGDIDVYVDCGIEKAREFAKSYGQKNVEYAYKHLQLEIWEDTEIEMHVRVEVLLNLWKNRKLQKWFHKHQDAVQGSKFKVQDGEIVTPTVEFNVFYILLHIYRHFLYEGVGLRQIVDYYMVLRTVQGSMFKVQEYVDAVHEFGMETFAKGLMWVMQEALGMPREWMLWKPEKKEGEYILNQVMAGGNFGHHKKRNNKIGGKFGTFLRICSHNIHLFSHYPSDTIWAPFYFVWLKLWKMTRRA